MKNPKKTKKKKELNGTKNPFKLFPTIKYLIKEEALKERFPYSGTEAYCGAQGTGKTISVVKRAKEILNKYPRCILISNVEIKGIKNKTFYFKNTNELMKLFKTEVKENNPYGYLVIIDEIHIVFSNMFYNGIDPEILKWLSQQRKSAMKILGTAQMFMKCPKGFRDYILQSGQIINCHKRGLLQTNSILDMKKTYEINNTLVMERAYTEWWFHTKELYEAYDTFAVISMITSEIKEKEERRLL